MHSRTSRMTPVLVCPDYSKPFQIFSFSSTDTIVGVLLQKNEKNEEELIAFMNKYLRDVELKYHIMKKQAYALVKYIAYFISYIFAITCNN